MSDIGRVEWIDAAFAELRRRQKLLEHAPNVWKDLKAAIDDAIDYFKAQAKNLHVETNGNQEYIRTLGLQNIQGPNAQWRRKLVVTFTRAALSIHGSYEFDPDKSPPARNLKIDTVRSEPGLICEGKDLTTSQAAMILLTPVFFPELAQEFWESRLGQ